MPTRTLIPLAIVTDLNQLQDWFQYLNKITRGKRVNWIKLKQNASWLNLLRC